MQRKLSRLQNIKAEIWKFDCSSNVYLLNLDEPIVIDTGRRRESDVLKTYMAKIVPLEKIKKVIFTHLHYDHIGNFDLFRNAEFFASKAEIDAWKKEPFGAILDEDMAERFNPNLKPIRDFGPFKIIETPGHTVGSICIFYEPDKIMFSGDTFFKKGIVGRTDLPTSVPEKMNASFQKLLEYDYKIVCPGHDY